jgi:PTS system nitrogen regulatory IIA component
VKLSDILDRDLILPNLAATTQRGAFEEMAQAISRKLEMDAQKVVAALADREATRSTALEKTGVAIPHARLNGITGFNMLFARSRGGIDFNAEDGKPTYLFFLLVGPSNEPGEYLRLLSRVARLCHSDAFRAKLLQAPTIDQIREIIAEEDAKG